MTVALKGSLVLVGTGKMGGAMLEGWLKNGTDPSRIIAVDPSPPGEMKALIDQYAIRHNPPLDTIKDAEVVVIAVKPQVMDSVLPNISVLKGSNPLVVSVAAGKKIAVFEEHFGKTAAVIRTIPNTPAAIGRGITAMAANPHVSESQKVLASALLSAVGEVVDVKDEYYIDAATAVSGSGPAYVFLLTECLAAAGVKVGLQADVAMKLARATVAGAGELMRTTGLPAETLRRNVTSPNGTTHAALQVLMAEHAIPEIMDKAIDAATRRSRELAS